MPTERCDVYLVVEEVENIHRSFSSSNLVSEIPSSEFERLNEYDGCKSGRNDVVTPFCHLRHDCLARITNQDKIERITMDKKT